MKKFCTSLREHAKNIIDFEKKKMLLLTKDNDKMIMIKMIKIIGKLKIIAILQVGIEAQHIVFVI